MNCAPLIRFPGDEKRYRRGSAGRFTPVLAVAFLLASCASEPTRFGATTRSVGADEAVAMPPPGNLAVVDVVEKRYDNALQQEIFLSTSSAVPGQNVMSVQFFGTKSPLKFNDDQLSYTPLTEARINSEMRGTLPGVRMVRSPLVVQNDYGSFGYAFGRASGTDLCMYGWQQIRSPSGTVSPLNNYGAIQIRVRLCETGASEEKLLSFMYGFSIIGSLDDPGWNPYGTPAPVSSRLGRSGAPIYPPNTGESPLPRYGVSPLSSVAADAMRPKPAQQTRRRAATEPESVTTQAPVATAPALAEQYPDIVVPTPGGGGRAVTPQVPQPARSQAVAPVRPPVAAVAGTPRVPSAPVVPSPGTVSVPSPVTQSPVTRPQAVPSTVRQVGPGALVPSPACVAGADGRLLERCR